MAILYDWYENPGESDDSEEKGLHPRIFLNGKVVGVAMFKPYAFFGEFVDMRGLIIAAIGSNAFIAKVIGHY